MWGFLASRGGVHAGRVCGIYLVDCSSFLLLLLVFFFFLFFFPGRESAGNSQKVHFLLRRCVKGARKEKEGYKEFDERCGIWIRGGGGISPAEGRDGGHGGDPREGGGGGCFVGVLILAACLSRCPVTFLHGCRVAPGCCT